MSDRTWRLDEHPSLPHRLGRHVRHDPRSLAYRVVADRGITMVAEWRPTD